MLKHFHQNEEFHSLHSSGAFIGQWLVCLPLDPRLMGSNPAKDDRILRVIKIHSITFFGEEVKLPVSCLKNLWHVKEPYECE
jgi:hypothetical protein